MRAELFSLLIALSNTVNHLALSTTIVAGASQYERLTQFQRLLFKHHPLTEGPGAVELRAPCRSAPCSNPPWRPFLRRSCAPSSSASSGTCMPVSKPMHTGRDPMSVVTCSRGWDVCCTCRIWESLRKELACRLVAEDDPWGSRPIFPGGGGSQPLREAEVTDRDCECHAALTRRSLSSGMRIRFRRCTTHRCAQPVILWGCCGSVACK